MSSVAVMWTPLVFGFALFLGSALLLVVQLMLGRTLLPHVGGNSIGWNACLVFVQATLLAGYLHANLLHRFRGLRWQPWLQILLIGVAAAFTFGRLSSVESLHELAPRVDLLSTGPILSTVCLLVVTIGLPFFALAAVRPLVHRWFSHLDHPKATDPFFLLVACNLGGLTGLLVYALLIEPYTPMDAQWQSWNLAVTALGVLIFIVALCAWRSPRSLEMEPPPTPDDPNAPLIPRLIGRGPATWRRGFYWLFASAIPVGMMMGLTDFLTLDIAPTPILWTVPLALYLIAFAQSFARFTPLAGRTGVKIALQVCFGFMLAFALLLVRAVVSNINPNNGGDEVPFMLACCFFFVTLLLLPFSWVGVAQPIAVLTVVFLQANLSRSTGFHPGTIVLFLACFYLSARLCLGKLAEDRPAAPALTSYFTWIGAGGLCGALFQVLVAPLLFHRDYLEYAMLATLATTMRAAWFPHGLADWLLCVVLFPNRKEQPTSGPTRVTLIFDMGLALVVAVFAGVVFLLRSEVRHGPSPMADFPLLFALFAALVLFARPVRFGLAVCAIVVLCWIGQDPLAGPGNSVFQRRSTFGIIRAADRGHDLRFQAVDPNDRLPARFVERRLMHGSTHRGSSITQPVELARYPTAYYHRKGPVGQIMRNLEWFRTPAEELRRGSPEFWLRRNRDNAKDDARIAASIIGMGVGGSADLLTTAWSEPPFAVVGLGTGTMLAYAHPFQTVDLYELDPAIIEMSAVGNPVFSYFHAARNRGVHAKIVPGDARRNLSRHGPVGFYHAIFVDAYQSDALPTHLATQEAIEVYFHKLVPDGVVCFRASTRQDVDLARVLENMARHMGLEVRAIADNPTSSGDPLYSPSEWIVLARNPAALQKWTDGAAFDRGANQFQGQQQRISVAVRWTDEHASVLSAVRPGRVWPYIIYGLLVMLLFFAALLGLIEVAYAMTAQPLPKQPTGPQST